MPLVECDRCGHKYISHSLSEDEIAGMYQDDTYFAHGYGSGLDCAYDDNLAVNENKARHALDQIHRYVRSGDLLEVGCAGGHFLKVARARYHYNVRGIEISGDQADRARASGLNVRAGSLEVLTDDEMFDIIYMGDVLEHSATPLLFLREAKTHLKPNGVLAIEIPLTYNYSLLGILFGILASFRRISVRRELFVLSQHRRLFHRSPPYHLQEFMPRSAELLVKLAGLRIVQSRYYDGTPKEAGVTSAVNILRSVTSYLTRHIPGNRLGDRGFIIATHPNARVLAV